MGDKLDSSLNIPVWPRFTKATIVQGFAGVKLGTRDCLRNSPESTFRYKLAALASESLCLGQLTRLRVVLVSLQTRHLLWDYS